MSKTIEPDNQLLGGMYGKTAEEQLVFPLKHTEVLAKIAGNLSRVEVTQTFENPFSEPLEAVYVFPLPDEAVVDNMEIKIGDRTIKGNIKKREEAQQIYSQARSQGRTAAYSNNNGTMFLPSFWLTSDLANKLTLQFATQIA